MRNPLRKRFFRELRSGAGQYIVMFVMLVLIIGMVSGYLVAGDSLMASYDESFEKYNVEDGNFTVSHRLNKASLRDIEEFGVSVYPLFYYECVSGKNNETTVRIFKNREECDRICLMEGALPEKADETAIDRMYADNNGVAIGDVIMLDGKEHTVTGLVAFPDYSCLFKNNNDSMFDAKDFGTAVVTDEEFDLLSAGEPVYRYAWTYDVPPEDEDAEADLAEDFTDHLHECTTIRECIPRYQNHAITFTGDDFGSDRQMMVIILYIIVIIITFVFLITANNTITKEAAVIGTLRASGYTRGEIIRHYMAYPVAVTIAGSIIGNVMGYTFMEDFMAGLYYGSYSLVTYETLLSADAFIMTTVIPSIIVIAASFLVIGWRLTLSPMKFLRRDLKRRKQKRVVRLSPKIPFFTRFRTRILFQNMGSYLVMILGIFFGNVLLMFGMGMPESLDTYKQYMTEHMIADYQYILTIPDDVFYGDTKLESFLALAEYEEGIATENEDAEKFSAYTLKYRKGGNLSEEIMLYGLVPESRYVSLDPGDDQVYISSAFSEKFNIQPGDTVTLQEPYDNDEYSFFISGIYDYEGGLSLYMSQEKLNSLLDWDEDFFCGYLSSSEITDIDEEYIGTVIDYDTVTTIAKQLDISMGQMMYLVDVIGVIIYILLIYILSKMIIEKNSQSISMVKILGYSGGEVGRLYIVATTVVVILSLICTLPLAEIVMQFLFKNIMIRMNGWLIWEFGLRGKITMVLIGLAAYAAVALLELLKIKKVPMDQALKNVE